MKQIIFISSIFAMLFLAPITKASEAEKILIVLTNHSELGNTGKKTGFWLPELTHPYYILKEAGFQVDIASPLGGMAPVDANSFLEDDEDNERFLKDAELMAKVVRTIPLNKIRSKDYKAILFSGGSGPMWDFPNNKDIHRISSAIYDDKGIVAAVCHGNVALINIKLSNGELLVKNRRIASFTNAEEKMLGTQEVIPFLLEDKLKERGAIHINAAPWQENVIIDGQVITGQNPASAKKLAQEIIKALRNK